MTTLIFLLFGYGLAAMFAAFWMRDRHAHKRGPGHTASSDASAPVRTASGKSEYIAELEDEITERCRFAEALRESEERYRSVITAMTEGVVVQNADGGIYACNAAAERILGLTRDQMTGRTSIDPRWHAVHEDGSPFPGETHPAMVTLRTGEACHGVMMGVHKPDGALTWISINSQPILLSDDDTPSAVVSTFHDITDRKAAEEQMRSRERMLNAMSEAAHDAMMIIDSDDTIIFWNKAAERMFGYPKSEAVNRQLHPLITPEEDCRKAMRGMRAFAATGTGPVMNSVMEFTAIRKNGEHFPVERSVAAFQMAEKWYAVGSLRDITDRKQAENQLRTLANTDGLTGVFNRRHFMQAAEYELERARRYNRPLSLLMIDADHFKHVNDTYGHSAGDAVLQFLTATASADLRKVDMIGRVGGEEFAILLPETSVESAAAAAERVRMAIEAAEVSAADAVVRFTVSIGVAGLGSGGRTIDDLLRSADDALYAAKESGRNRVVVHNSPHSM